MQFKLQLHLVLECEKNENNVKEASKSALRLQLNPQKQAILKTMNGLAEYFVQVQAWSSLVEGDEGWIGPSKKLLCLR